MMSAVARGARQAGRVTGDRPHRAERPYVCMIAYTDYAYDARVRREAVLHSCVYSNIMVGAMLNSAL